jgi:hypothetical protein
VRHVLGAAALILAIAGASAAQAQAYGHYGYGPRVVESTGWRSRAPWQEPWQYDTGGDNDNRPELNPLAAERRAADWRACPQSRAAGQPPHRAALTRAGD